MSKLPVCYYYQGCIFQKTNFSPSAYHALIKTFPKFSPFFCTHALLSRLDLKNFPSPQKLPQRENIFPRYLSQKNRRIFNPDDYYTNERHDSQSCVNVKAIVACRRRKEVLTDFKYCVCYPFHVRHLYVKYISAYPKLS